VKPVLVGESSVDGEAFAGGYSACRLARLVGVPVAELPGVFSMVNLLGPEDDGAAWPASRARAAAGILRAALGGRRLLVLCGRRVASAFGVGELPFFERARSGSFDVVVVPHPSGRSRWWNDPWNRRQARAFFGRLRG
jgi:hypothetical protein